MFQVELLVRESHGQGWRNSQEQSVIASVLARKPRTAWPQWSFGWGTAETGSSISQSFSFLRFDVASVLLCIASAALAAGLTLAPAQNAKRPLKS